ncbi:oligopeptide ABC transporter permease OppC [Kistimonas scapharcae]|uniref:Oligopeptide transport system permease protein OppC n=1 Tax=Kistimonas scapharcae TaxID=1036133 RepID=A0ABP8V8L5_9GAMM
MSLMNNKSDPILNTGAMEALADKLSPSIEIEGRSLWADARARFLRNRAAIASLVILALIGLLVIFGPMLSPYSYDEIDWANMSVPPALDNSHWFGTDSLGRDLFVRTLMGGRISFMVGIMGALVAVLIGTLYGAIAGFSGGRTDSIMMRILEILQSFPFMFLVILMVTFFGRSILLIFIAIGAVSWLDMARIVRGQTLSLKNKEFIEAARVCGTPTHRMILQHIVPNVLGIVVVYASLLVPGMILFESFLSFLGLGVQEPMTSWGALVNEGAQAMEVAAWQLAFPVAFLVITLFCFNFVGDGLRDALDPKDR